MLGGGDGDETIHLCAFCWSHLGYVFKLYPFHERMFIITDFLGSLPEGESLWGIHQYMTVERLQFTSMPIKCGIKNISILLKRWIKEKQTTIFWISYRKFTNGIFFMNCLSMAMLTNAACGGDPAARYSLQGGSSPCSQLVEPVPPPKLHSCLPVTWWSIPRHFCYRRDKFWKFQSLKVKKVLSKVCIARLTGNIPTNHLS